MSGNGSERSSQRTRAALAAYLRLLAACLEDEADLVENDPSRSDDVLRRFREGVLALSLEEAPIDALMDHMAAPAAGADRDGHAGSGNGKSILVAGHPDGIAPRPRQRRR